MKSLFMLSMLKYLSYFGGSGNDTAHDITVDEFGNIGAKLRNNNFGNIVYDEKTIWPKDFDPSTFGVEIDNFR